LWRVSSPTELILDLRPARADHPPARFSSADPANPPLTPGRHADDFGDRLHRTHFFGGAVPAGQVWRAKDIFKNVFVSTAKPLVDKYGQNDLPDPALLLALPNDEQPGASAYWFQKTYEGEWSVDVFLDSKEVVGKVDAGVLDVGLEAARVAFEGRFGASATFPPRLELWAPRAF